MPTSKFTLLFALACFAASLSRAQSAISKPDTTEFADVEVVGHVVEPRKLPPAAGELSALRVPAGFEVNVFAEELENPRMLAVAGDGTVYATRRELGDVLMLRDTDGDGQADERRVVANRPGMHGIAISGDTMYLTTVKDLYRTKIAEDGSLGKLELLLDDLPDGGQHPNRMVLVGPDNMLYVTSGSTCNACGETNVENATMLQVAPDGSSRKIYASGLRNTIGYGFQPTSGKLYGMDHGIDWLGDNEQHEELNQIVEGAAYGWPYVYADGKPNPADYPTNGITMEEWSAQSAHAIGLYTPHAAPMQLAYYTADSYPSEYRGDAFIAMRGSWNRLPPSGYEVVRIRFDEAGEPTDFEPFVQGFVEELTDGKWGHRGRLCGVAQAGDGSVLFTDDTNGVIYRVSYTGDSASTAEATAEPTNSEGAAIGMTSAAVATPPAKAPRELTIGLVGAPAKLKVESSAFDANSKIPDAYGAEGENISPAVSWSGAPAETVGYVVLIEDPDVSGGPPFLHWSIYDLDSTVTSLAEAVPTGAATVAPESRQGANDYGSLGYYGMRPPEGEEHAYHVEVFAVDAPLELPFGASRAEVVDALRGHVLAAGELVGTFAR